MKNFSRNVIFFLILIPQLEFDLVTRFKYMIVGHELF